MKVHYINILLFALPLNILVNTNKKTSISHHTQTKRSLCECELYAPANYDNDPHIKEVMENFNRQTSQRFHEYDERMKTTRQKCKEHCDKEIQKIILKDKIEKELTEKLTTLDTNINTEDIPTCICEKSIADKVEKGCLRCGGVFGGGVMPAFGTIGGTALYALNVLKPKAIAAAIAAAKKAGALAGKAEGLKEGMRVVIGVLEQRGVGDFCPKLLESIGSTIPYTDAGEIGKIILENLTKKCGVNAPVGSDAVCTSIRTKLGLILPNGESAAPDKFYIEQMMKEIVYKAKMTATEASSIESTRVTAQLTTEKTGAIAANYMGNQTIIIASIIAIVVIVLIMVIIYLILRHRRKKKMKKKLQYIKLLEE